jgi:hypothetical protein
MPGERQQDQRRVKAALAILKRWHNEFNKSGSDGHRRLSDEVALLKVFENRDAKPPLQLSERVVAESASPSLNRRVAWLEAAIVPHPVSSSYVDFGLRIVVAEGATGTDNARQVGNMGRTQIPVREFNEGLLRVVPAAAVVGLARNIDQIQRRVGAYRRGAE